MLTIITTAVLVGRPFYLECRRVPAIEIIVDIHNLDKELSFRSRVVVSELRHAAGGDGYYIGRFADVRTIGIEDFRGDLPVVRCPAYRHGRNGPWTSFPRGTFSAPGTFTLTLRAEIEWETWCRHCTEIINAERPSYNGTWRSLPPQPTCWTPSGFDRRRFLRDVGVEDTEDRLMELLQP